MKRLGILAVVLFMAAQVAFAETIVFSRSGYQTQEVTAVAGDTNIIVHLVAVANNTAIPLTWDHPILANVVEVNSQIKVAAGQTVSDRSIA